MMNLSSRTVLGINAPPAQPTLFGAALVAGMVTLPFAGLVVFVTLRWG